jgi:hypothetical protein
MTPSGAQRIMGNDITTEYLPQTSQVSASVTSVLMTRKLKSMSLSGLTYIPNFMQTCCLSQDIFSIWADGWTMNLTGILQGYCECANKERLIIALVYICR